MNEIGVVITLPPGREENLKLAVHYLSRMSIHPRALVIVCDGPGVNLDLGEMPLAGDMLATERKHEPGMEQPRNVGVRFLRDHHPSITHAWFLDSDIVVDPGALAAYYAAIAVAGDKSILIGPYDWMTDGMREPHPELRSDFRWDMFDERGLGPWVGELGVALGCFGGNLVWPIDEFIRVGGFHHMLHHGRCEDGELGLRAATHRIPMALVREARGYHVAHAVNHELAVARNARDVPLINAWHPWVEEKGIVMAEQDGVRFEFVCACGEQLNTLLMWEHAARCPGVAPPASDLILPEGM